MAVIRTCALEALRDLIAAAIPELDGKICVGQPDPNHWATWPSLTIIATKWTWIPFVEVLVGSVGASTAIYNVGEHEALVQLRVTAPTPTERDELAGQVVQVFLDAVDPNSGIGRAGIITTDVTDCLDVPFMAAFELDDDELIHMPAPEQEYEALIQTTGIIPALVTRQGEYTIDELRLGVAGLAVSVTAGTFTPPNVEVVSIAEDGTISPVTP